MNEIIVGDLLYITGGNTKIVILNIANNRYEELWRGKIEDINFNNIPYEKNEIQHVTVIEGEDILQIHIEV